LQQQLQCFEGPQGLSVHHIAELVSAHDVQVHPPSLRLMLV
jgi:hypothetical protein